MNSRTDRVLCFAAPRPTVAVVTVRSDRASVYARCRIACSRRNRPRHGPDQRVPHLHATDRPRGKQTTLPRYLVTAGIRCPADGPPKSRSLPGPTVTKSSVFRSFLGHPTPRNRPLGRTDGPCGILQAVWNRVIVSAAFRSTRWYRRPYSSTLKVASAFYYDRSL